MFAMARPRPEPAPVAIPKSVSGRTEALRHPPKIDATCDDKDVAGRARRVQVHEELERVEVADVRHGHEEDQLSRG